MSLFILILLKVENFLEESVAILIAFASLRLVAI